MIEGKLLCIKTFIIGEVIENKKGKIYDFYDTSDTKGYWVDSEDGYSATLFDGNLSEYFITLAEWREQQINSILDE